MSPELPYGAALQGTEVLESRGFPTLNPFDGKHAWDPPRIARLDNHLGRIGGSSPSAHTSPGSDPLGIQHSHSRRRRHCPDQMLLSELGGQRVCRIRNAGARTHTRVTPAP